MKPLIPILLLIGLTARAADPSLAALPKMTAAEAAETVLNEGVIVRIINTEPADVRVGDGATLGGVRIGDASGWIEGTALTQDLEVGSHKINLGNWSLRTLGGWTAISGGTTSTDSGSYQVSIAGSVMLQMLGANSLTEISRFAYDGTYFQLDTALGELPAAIESSPSLISPDWTAATVHHCTTNNGIITHFIDPDQYDAYAYFRAAVTTGTGAYANFNAEIRQYGEPVALQSDLGGLISSTGGTATSLSVFGAGTSATTYAMTAVNGSGDKCFRIRDDGRVFVGAVDVTDSNSKFNVDGSVYVAGNIVNGGTAYLGAIAAPAGNSLRLKTYDRDVIYFTTSTSGAQELMLGAGTDTPSERITVNGNINMLSDGNEILFGSGKDAGIAYDGTNLCVNARHAGSGGIDVGDAPLIFHGSTGGTNRTAVLSWDFDNNVFSVAVTDD